MAEDPPETTIFRPLLSTRHSQALVPTPTRTLPKYRPLTPTRSALRRQTTFKRRRKRKRLYDEDLQALVDERGFGMCLPTQIALYERNLRLDQQYMGSQNGIHIDDIYPLIQLLSSSRSSSFGLRIPAGIFGRIDDLGMQYLTIRFPNFGLSLACRSVEESECVIRHARGCGEFGRRDKDNSSDSPAIPYFLQPMMVNCLPMSICLHSGTVLRYKIHFVMPYNLLFTLHSDAMHPHGIYYLIIDLNGYPYLDQRPENLQLRSVSDITEAVAAITISTSNTKAWASDTEAAAVDADADEAEETEVMAVRRVNDFSQYVEQSCNALAAFGMKRMELFTKLGLRYVCVTDFAGKYIGVIHKKRLSTFLKQSE
ncbi:hypothetical protein BC937DRAFT_86124 [Endogone sp. FLAS-F59071]|nr:hypothetical protein BC937DRAFT_86124 [Endogone sp. FLAS-F59071]|eukprot:RUS23439.1 hypothetical protein BC937DRAFT_86124 [Endogone sp. FLAS-F59071]